MRALLCLSAVLAAAPAAVAQSSVPPPVVSGLKNPESVAVGPGGKIYVSVIGEFDKDGDGSIVVVENGKAAPFVTGLNDPKGLAVFAGRVLYVADKNRVVRVDLATGKATDYVKPENFPNPPKFLNDVVVDPESGAIYVSDSGDFQGNGGAVYRIAPSFPPKGKGPVTEPKPPAVSVVVDAKKLPGLHTPNGLAMDGQSHLLMLDMGTGTLHRIKLASGAAEKVADGFGKADGICWDHFGRLFVTDHPAGKLWAIPRPGEKPVVMAQGFQGAADICLGPDGKTILVPDMKAGTLHAVPINVPGAEVDTSPMPVEAAVAFPDLKWTGWKPQTDDGRPNQLRPILLTHFGDGSNRVVVPTQHGVIHAFPNDQAAKATTVFLDITDRVKYDDRTNEEGFLGLAFHPKYKENGEFFVFYTPKYKGKDGQNVVSRFRVSKTDPNKADPASEEVLLRFTKPFWNHDGGTICFGPDGYLYITHGDGGLANDPFDNGQNINSLLGKVLRIDVNAKEDGKNYAIPKDNPFVGRKDARGEIWAYGVRNLWRMSFDRKTGDLWAGEVGQNLYEEIILVKKGGNYGWNRRESYHPFGPKGVDVNKDMVEPIWEYHHDVGKSITGGNVYHGGRLPELDGYYLYGDYVSARMWAMKYDAKAGRVVANRPVKDPNVPIYSYGEDEKGEVYFLTATNTGAKGIYWFVQSKGAAGGR